MAEGLLDHHTAPAARGVVDQSRGGHALGDGGEPAGRDGQVEGAVAAGAPAGVQLGDHAGQALIGLVVLEGGEGHESHPLGQLLPDALVPGGTGVGPDAATHVGAHVLVAPVAPSDSHQ